MKMLKKHEGNVIFIPLHEFVARIWGEMSNIDEKNGWKQKKREKKVN